MREQLARVARDPVPELRATPVEGVLLTDAEIDHTLGLVLLREGRHLRVHCTAAVHRILEHDSALLGLTRAFADVDVTELPLDVPAALLDGDGGLLGLTIEAFPVAGDSPRFASADERGHTIGVVIRSDDGGACAYLPGCGALDDALLARIAALPLVVIDGTFWSDDELVRLGLSDRSARQMGHMPVGGADGSLARLRLVAGSTTVVYTHINNSNPMLVEDSPERAAVTRAGCVVGEDGMCFRVTSDGTTVTRHA